MRGSLIGCFIISVSEGGHQENTPIIKQVKAKLLIWLKSTVKARNELGRRTMKKKLMQYAIPSNKELLDHCGPPHTGIITIYNFNWQSKGPEITNCSAAKLVTHA